MMLRICLWSCAIFVALCVPAVAQVDERPLNVRVVPAFPNV